MSATPLVHLTAIGASAGGLQSLKPIITTLQPNERDCFVLAHHLPSDQPSSFAEILANQCALQVRFAQEGQVLQAGCIYVCPPNTDIEIIEGKIALLQPYSKALISPSIDRLFSSLAANFGANATVVVLSGAGQDGLQGARDVRLAGGTVIVQTPEEAVQPSMPEHVIKNGWANLVGSVKEIAKWLQHREQLIAELPPKSDTAQHQLKELLQLVSSTTGLDLSQYKENTLRRQVTRRYQSLGFENFESYFEFVRNQPEEIAALQQAFLISVTAFFRDPAVFEALHQVLTERLNKLRQGQAFRVWVPGCATGEEPYSIAILIAEILGKRLTELDVRIFATDIEQSALEKARTGYYSASTLSTIRLDWQNRWFSKVENGGQISKAIRDLVLFTTHDVSSHPPFIKMDLISCRNMLIYFKAEQQSELIRTFHYSLNMGGILLLGRSESLGLNSNLFSTVDGEHKIFRRGSHSAHYPIRALRLNSPTLPQQPTFPKSVGGLQRQSLVENALSTLAQTFAPPAILLNANFEPVHFFGRAQRFCSITEDNADFTIFALCPAPLRHVLKALCYRLIQENLQTLAGGTVFTEIDGTPQHIRLLLKRLSRTDETADFSLLVCFETISSTPTSSPVPLQAPETSPPEEVAMLRLELANAREHLQAVIEELEASNEELQSLNEEVQSSSEELQASNEELQASNEELTTLNDQLRAKSQEAQELNITLGNIQNSMRTSLLVVDCSIRITRFNSLATRIFGLVHSDLGHALLQVPCHLNLPDLKQQIESVINSQCSVVEQVHQQNFHYLMQIDPYRNEQDQVAGAILTFADISDLHRAEQAKNNTEKRFRQVWESSVEGMLVADTEGSILMVNPALASMFGYSTEEMLGLAVEALVPTTLRTDHSLWRSHFLDNPMPRKMAQMRSVRGRRKSGEEFFVEVSLSSMVVEGQALALATVSDVSIRKNLENSYRRSEEQLRIALSAAQAGVWQWDLESNENSWSDSLWQLFGYSNHEIQPSFAAWISSARNSDQARLAHTLSQATQAGQDFEIEWQTQGSANQSPRWLFARGQAVPNAHGPSSQYQGIVLDISERKLLEHETQLWASSFQQSDINLAIGDPKNNTFVSVNPSFARRRGYKPEELQGRLIATVFAPEALDQAILNIRHLDEVGHGVFESIHIDKFGQRFPVLIDLNVIKSAEGTPIKRVAYVQDITERKQAEEKLRLASLVFANSSEAIVVTDEAGRILASNPAFSSISGYTESEVLGKSPRFLLAHPEQHEQKIEAIISALASHGQWQGEIWGLRKNGAAYPALIDINRTLGPNNTSYQYIALLMDITERKSAELEIAKQAHYDHLTQLPNRRLFQDRLHQELEKAQRENQKIALLFVDLDHFKDVNDTQGHELGDELLIEAADRIKAAVRTYDTVARFGGDEFVIILGELNHVSSAARIAEEVIDALSREFVLQGQEFFISASIGIAVFPDDANDVTGLIKCADQAMYKAKGEGRRCFRFFTRSMQESIAQRSRVAAELRHAIERKQLQLHYQPIVHLGTGHIHKAEALLRWSHPQLGQVNPSEFIPVAEESGLIHDIGEWVFQEATQQTKRWQLKFQPHFQISINKSPSQFRHQNRCEQWIQTLREMQLSGQSIVIEITEGLLMDEGAHVAHTLLKYRDAGIQVSIDDFGTGYSALSYLKKFDIDYLKIDQSFTRNLAPDSSDFALCEAIVMMAHKLELQVIAEGVETQLQFELLKAMQCDFGQGYFFSRPIPAFEFEQMLSQRGDEITD